MGHGVKARGWAGGGGGASAAGGVTTTGGATSANPCPGRADWTPCAVVTVPDRHYDICVEGTCVPPGCGDATCNVSGPHFPLADTGQRLCGAVDLIMKAALNDKSSLCERMSLPSRRRFGSEA